MGRYLAICAYDGTNFLGFQKQNEGRTVQNEIEKVISTILNKETSITASGRTDAKVHALNQPFHFDSDKELDLNRFCHSLNMMLDKDIHIKSITKVDDNFHARINAKEKTYYYIINMGESNPLKINYEYDLGKKLDFELMKKASMKLIGTHNFMNLTSKEEDHNNFIRTINSIDLKIDGENLTIEFNGNGFMRYMIRMMVGTLVEIGLHKVDITIMDDLLNESKPRKTCSYKAPGQGLYLKEVKY